MRAWSVLCSDRVVTFDSHSRPAPLTAGDAALVGIESSLIDEPFIDPPDIRIVGLHHREVDAPRFRPGQLDVARQMLRDNCGMFVVNANEPTAQHNLRHRR